MKRTIQALAVSVLMAAGCAFAQTHGGSGIVKKIEPAKSSVTIRHDAIKSLNWPAMTMDFPVRDKAVLSKLKPEQPVTFDLVQEKGRYVITAIK